MEKAMSWLWWVDIGRVTDPNHSNSMWTSKHSASIYIS